MDQEVTHHRFLNGEVDKALRTLMEHFDSLQFVGTYVDDDGMTHLLTQGRGNWFARMGAAREFIERDQAQTAADAIGDVMMIEEDETGFD
jgi:hypothetical protein